MNKQQARLVLYQLAEAFNLITAVARGEADREAAVAFGFRMMGIPESDVDTFFETPEGNRLAARFKL